LVAERSGLSLLVAVRPHLSSTSFTSTMLNAQYTPADERRCYAGTSAMRIYLDYNATAPAAPGVADLVARVLSDEPGNPSSIHTFGQQAKTRLDEARAAVAALIDARPSDVILTGGGTEAINLALRGVAAHQETRTDALDARRHIVISAIEHEAVGQTAAALARRGWHVTEAPVSRGGVIDLDALAACVTDATALVAVMHANNEIGTVQPIAEVAAMTHARGALLLVDAVQSAGKIPVSVTALGADLLAISGHKFGGPKGTGALWVRRGVSLVAHTTGGRQERSRRAGTENVAGLAGMAVAARWALSQLPTEAPRQAALRDRLEREVCARVPQVAVNGTIDARVPNTTNLSFDGIEAESLLMALDLAGIAISTGAACSSGTLEPSHVLRALGASAARTRNSLRFSLGAGTTDADITRVLDVLPPLVDKLRALSGRTRTTTTRLPQTTEVH
jgi:cysteine desulfurase